MSKPLAASLPRAGQALLGRPYREMDCQQFVENCLREIGISLNLPGSNAWYRRMTWTGTPEECVSRFGSVPPGAFLFLLSQDGGDQARGYTDGLGNASHMGLRTASGALHASASRGCVCESAFRERTVSGGWNRVGLWDALDWGEKVNRLLRDPAAAPAPAAAASPASLSSAPASGVRAVTVSSENGKPVKLRQASTPHSKAYAVWSEIPCGTVGILLSAGAEWSRVQFGRQAGYMQNRFLTLGGFTALSGADAAGDGDGRLSVPLLLTREEARLLLSVSERLVTELRARAGA